MLLASVNTELLLAQRFGCEDMSSASPVGHVLKAKAERALGAAEGFTTLREIAGMPDVAKAVLSKQIAIDEIIRLGQSRDGQQYRIWFHEHCRSDPLQIAREYVALLHQVPRMQRLPARVIRFIITTAIGAIPSAGMIAVRWLTRLTASSLIDYDSVVRRSSLSRASDRQVPSFRRGIRLGHQ